MNKKGTLCLLADFDSENEIRALMKRGAAEGGVGVAAAGLPRHISLGMPYEVKYWEAYEKFAGRLAETLSTVKVRISDIGAGKISEQFGSYFLKFEEDFGLEELRLNVKKALVEELGLEMPEKDGVAGQKSITLGFGTAPYETYKAFVDGVDKSFIGKELTFSELGVFYYDQPFIAANNFFCCRRFRLN